MCVCVVSCISVCVLLVCFLFCLLGWLLFGLFDCALFRKTSLNGVVPG